MKFYDKKLTKTEEKVPANPFSSPSLFGPVSKPGPKPKMKAIDQLFTFLTWLRLGFTLGLTAWPFNMPKLTISRYPITWSNFLYLNLGCISVLHPKMNVLHQCHKYLKRHTLVLESLLYRVVLPKTFRFNNTK